MKELYKPFVSTNKNKKYSVYVKDGNKIKLINFGDTRYEHYYDTLGYYKHLNHYDKERRKNYLKRAYGIKNKDGEITYKDINSRNFWSIKILWTG